MTDGKGFERNGYGGDIYTLIRPHTYVWLGRFVGGLVDDDRMTFFLQIVCNERGQRMHTRITGCEASIALA